MSNITPTPDPRDPFPGRAELDAAVAALARARCDYAGSFVAPGGLDRVRDAAIAAVGHLERLDVLIARRQLDEALNPLAAEPTREPLIDGWPGGCDDPAWTAPDTGWDAAAALAAV